MVHANCPVATPAAVATPARRWPEIALRMVRAVSGPGTQITMSETPRKASNVDIVKV